MVIEMLHAPRLQVFVAQSSRRQDWRYRVGLQLQRSLAFKKHTQGKVDSADGPATTQLYQMENCRVELNRADTYLESVEFLEQTVFCGFLFLTRSTKKPLHDGDSEITV